MGLLIYNFSTRSFFNNDHNIYAFSIVNDSGFTLIITYSLIDATNLVIGYIVILYMSAL